MMALALPIGVIAMALGSPAAMLGLLGGVLVAVLVWWNVT
jgi:hypothetical protein